MNCDIYYTVNGDQMRLECDSRQSFGEIAYAFDGLMQNRVEEVLYVEEIDGKEKSRTRKEVLPHLSKGDYQLVCIHRAGIWCADFAEMAASSHSIESVHVYRRISARFSDERQLKFPPRVASVVSI